MMMGFGGLGLLLMFLFFAVIIGLAVWFVSYLFPRSDQITGLTMPRASRMPPSEGNSEDMALEILKQRYARWEITREEYLSMRADILED